ncbi:hypothetical protein C0585_05560 [Candidatus Woesearchaeota archaeon]|nr:MAG: hypothetical protein C0585_05560 [Candidatus Woesearchaeota archaeon]
MDKIDKVIIKNVSRDGRVSFREIAEQVGISHVAIKKRFDKLLKDERIKIGCMRNVKNCKLKYYWVYLSVVNKKELMKQVHNCDKIIDIMDTYGEFDIGLLFGVTNYSTIDCVLDKCIKLDKNNIKKRMTLPILDMDSGYIISSSEDKQCDKKKWCATCEYSKMQKCEGCD